MEALLLTHVAATLFLCGLTWTMQLVHYPLFASVGREGFVDYEAEHQSRIARVVGPVMVIELITGLALLWRAPSTSAIPALMVGAILIAFIWISTAVQAVPRHRELSNQFTASAHRGLLRANWNRTIAWSLRSMLVLWLLAPGGAAR